MMSINKHDPLSLYQQLYKLILEKIENGDWKSDGLIPTEREFTLQYNISRTTVRQAINLLEMRGYLYKIQGKGTYVAPPKLQPSLHTLKGFSETLQDSGIEPGQKIIFFGYVEPTQNVINRLKINDAQKLILMIKRLRYANKIPIGVQISYLNTNENYSLTANDLEVEGSLYRLLDKKLNLRPSVAFETVEAVLADSDEASLLEIQKGAPLLLVERVVRSSQLTPFEYLKTVFRADCYKYVAYQISDDKSQTENINFRVEPELLIN